MNERASKQTNAQTNEGMTARKIGHKFDEKYGKVHWTASCRLQLTCDQALFSFRSVKHSGGRAKRKIEPDTTLLRNVYRPLF